MRPRSNVVLCSGVLALSLHFPVPALAHEIAVEKYMFTPSELTIRKGETVTWINREKRVSHSVVFLGSGEESERFFPDERWSRRFDTPGRYEYRCGPHPEMLGTIVVAE